jgi:glutamate racemase
MTPAALPKRIGVYDSGVGGLSVTACVQSSIPDAQYFYLSDNLNFPYGTKSDEAVTLFTVKNCCKFIEIYELDILVIACNTASTVALDAVRAAVKIPVVGVVPAIKPAALQSKTKSIGLLATPATVKRQYTLKLIDDFANGCKVALRGSSVLVEVAEKKLRSATFSLAEIESEVEPLLALDPKIDVIVLGCTHFPLLKDDLSQLFPKIEWVDSGAAIAARVQSLVPSITPVLNRVRLDAGIAVFTAESAAAHSLHSALNRFGFRMIEFLKF